MRDSKIVLPYMDDEGNIHGETILATKEHDYYRIKSIPVHASKIALHDLIAIRRREGVLYFHKIIESSGRNVIQMIVFKGWLINAICKELEQFGCLWRHGDNKHLIAFDVPEHVPYRPIKDWLVQGQRQQQWGYREACLSHE